MSDRELSRMLFAAREQLEMWADVVAARSGYRDDAIDGLVADIDAYRVNRGWKRYGYGGEPERVDTSGGWPQGYAAGRQAALKAMAASTPEADWRAAWAELTAYVAEAEEDGGTLNAAELLPYMAELKATYITGPIKASLPPRPDSEADQ